MNSPSSRSCVLDGIGEALLDEEVWRLDLTLGDSATQEPFDLTGSDLAVTFRTVGSWEPVATCSTMAGNESFTIKSPLAGTVALVSLPSARAYRVPVTAGGFQPLPVRVWGDVLRRLKNDPASEPESLGQIQFTIRASTTQWPAPS